MRKKYLAILVCLTMLAGLLLGARPVLALTGSPYPFVGTGQVDGDGQNCLDEDDATQALFVGNLAGGAEETRTVNLCWQYDPVQGRVSTQGILMLVASTTARGNADLEVQIISPEGGTWTHRSAGPTCAVGTLVVHTPDMVSGAQYDTLSGGVWTFKIKNLRAQTAKDVAWQVRIPLALEVNQVAYCPPIDRLIWYP